MSGDKNAEICKIVANVKKSATEVTKMTIHVIAFVKNPNIVAIGK